MHSVQFNVIINRTASRVLTVPVNELNREIKLLIIIHILPGEIAIAHEKRKLFVNFWEKKIISIKKKLNAKFWSEDDPISFYVFSRDIESK